MSKLLILLVFISLTACATPVNLDTPVEQKTELESCESACSSGMVKEFRKGILRCVCNETSI